MTFRALVSVRRNSSASSAASFGSSDANAETLRPSNPPSPTAAPAAILSHARRWSGRRSRELPSCRSARMSSRCPAIASSPSSLHRPEDLHVVIMDREGGNDHDNQVQEGGPSRNREGSGHSPADARRLLSSLMTNRRRRVPRLLLRGRGTRGPSPGPDSQGVRFSSIGARRLRRYNTPDPRPMRGGRTAIPQSMNGMWGFR